MHPPSAALLRALARSSFAPETFTSRVLNSQRCSRQRAFVHSTRSQYAASPSPSSPPPPPPPQYSTPAASPSSKPSQTAGPDLRTPEMSHRRHRDGELQPKPLSKPLGLPFPPRPGQNTGRDDRSWSEKRDDFASYDKHLARRKKMLDDVFQNNYYKDIGNLGKIHRGKSILAPQTPFKAEMASYFPNLEGQTLESKGSFVDTAPAMLGKISIVSMLNTEWATGQAATFTSAGHNPELAVYMKSEEAREGGAQFFTINVEENPLKAFIVRLFWWRLRKIYPREQWGTYFLNRRGVTPEIRDALGMWNSKVGYVYLVDQRGRIRWAGNGDARDDEKKSLVYCIKRLVVEARGLQRMKVQRQEPMKTAKRTDATGGESALGDALGGIAGARA